MNVEARPQHSETQTARDILAIFFLKKRIFLLTFFSVVVAALLVSFLFPPIYKTSGKFLVKPQIQTPVLFDADAARTVSMENRVDVQVINTIVQLIKMPVVAGRVVDRLGLAESDTPKARKKAVDALLGSIDAKPLSLANIIDITIKNHDPREAVRLLNAYMDEFINYHISINQSLKGRLAFFEQQEKLYQRRYKLLNRKLAEASRMLHIIDPQLQTDKDLHVLRELELRLSERLAKLKALQTHLKLLKHAKRQLERTGRMSGVSTELLTEFPALVEMQKSIAQMVINIQRAKNDFRPNSKPVQDAIRQYRNMVNQIHIQIGAIIEAATNMVAARQQAVDELRKRIDQARKRATRLRTNTIALQRLELEVKLAKENYKLYADKREKARINLEKNKARFANIKIAERPLLPTSPWFPQKKKLLLLAIAVGLILATGMAISAYAMDPRVWTPHDLTSRTDLRFLGSLSHLSSEAAFGGGSSDG